ncbi:MAG: septum formation inhibitor Maf [Gammaproteobacteria bacterium]|nr:MAG: septum formation inhibitor Maf [Gammaproteobacteria bacterium]
MSKPQSIILGSSSPYRRELLQKLHIDFTSQPPEIDETADETESATELTSRLALLKAKRIAETNPDALIIGSDQVAVLDGRIIGKPITFDNAKKQLQAASGKTVEFITALCLLNSKNNTVQEETSVFKVHFRNLTDSEIESYLHMEKPFNCAGSFKSEGLGIALFSKLEGNDPNSLIGLPLIILCRMLKNAGVDILSKRAGDQ